MTYSLDVIGTFKTSAASPVGKVANIDQARKRSDSLGMEFREKRMCFWIVENVVVFDV
jgi:hypothetical protein